MTHTHFIGIGGTGLSAIARVLLGRGETVSGSDRTGGPLASALQADGATVYNGHAAENVLGADVVVRSSAVPDDNVEVLAAKAAGIPVLRREEYLPQFLQGLRVIAVAGSHGKTTTTSMIAWMFSALNLRPGYIVGGVVENLGNNAANGTGPFFVIEADEYDYMFWGLNPEFAVVTNVEHDHPDRFPTPESFTQAFEGFVERLAPHGLLAACVDDPGASYILEYARSLGREGASYSLGDDSADVVAVQAKANPNAGYSFRMYRAGEHLVDVSLQVPGEHNVRNALAALIVGEAMGLDLEECANALADFRGSGRRFEVLGETGGVLLVDDYGHHPTEIAATLQAARARYPQRRIWAVWQPHTYSRTTRLLDAFGAAFHEADQVVLMDVYAAREAQPEDFDIQKVFAAIQHETTLHAGAVGETAEALKSRLSQGDVVIVFSAGDATGINEELIEHFSQLEGAGQR